MKMPSLKKVDHLGPLTIPLHGLHAMALKYAEERFAQKGEVPPTFLVAIGTDVVWIEETWSSNEERGFKFALMRVLLQEMRARAYSFISEVYVASMTIEEAERYGLVTDIEHMPEDQRDEMLWIDSWDYQGASYNSRYLITPARPPARKRPFLGPRVDEEWDEQIGRASNLFDRPRRAR